MARIKYPDTAMLLDMLLEYTTHIRIDEDSLFFDAILNQVAAKKYQEMLEKTIEEYHARRRKHLSAEEAGFTQEQASEDIIKEATEQALAILREMNESRESFRKVGLTFEEKAFYDILVALREQYNFEYGTDRNISHCFYILTKQLPAQF